jgi:polar amino acid transport system substrate-binding protein
MGFTDDQVVWTRTGFDDAIAVGPKDFDFNIQQYSITEAREEVVDFSDPYYETSQALVGYSDSAVVGATSIDDLKGLKLGAQIGTTSLAYIEDVIQPDEPAAVYDDNVAAKSALDAKQVDALVFDLPTAYFVTAVEIEGSEIIGVLETPDDSADFFGLLMANDSPLRNCVNAALGRLRDAGTLDALADEWLQSAGDIPTISS